MRKTRQMLDLEARFGRPIEGLLVDALRDHGTLERAAASLGVNWKTMYGWLVRLRIPIRKTYVPDIEPEALAS